VRQLIIGAERSAGREHQTHELEGRHMARGLRGVVEGLGRAPSLLPWGILITGGSNLAVGLWLIAAVTIIPYDTAFRPVNDVVCGAAVAVISTVRLLAFDRWPALSLLGAAIGTWLLASALLLDGAQEALANDAGAA
jgi:hypothetical protein